jgi:hypothetical protein
VAEIFLTCEASDAEQSFSRRDYERLIMFAAKSKTKKHKLIDDPEAATIIVFAGSSRPNYSDVTTSNLFKRFRHKSLLFTSGGTTLPLLPGFYPCLENRWFNRKQQSAIAGFYLRVAENDLMDIEEDIDDAKYLFSFLGSSRTHPVRRELLKLESDRCYLEDSSKFQEKQNDQRRSPNFDRRLHYRDILAQSKFVLCPRGIGVSSWRLFETMRAERVPVIISDDWTPPIGPHWESFAILVREKEIHWIPEILREYESRAKQLANQARLAWETWYAEDVIFDTTIDLLLLAQSKRAFESGFARSLVYLGYLEPYYFRHWVLSPIKKQIVQYFGKSASSRQKMRDDPE